MIELMCDCPELQDKHTFNVGDYVYDKGMMNIFSWGSGGQGPKQAASYLWSQCADKLQRIPTKKELIHFAELKRNRKKKQYAKHNDRYPALEEDFVINWYGGGGQFIIDRYSIDKFRQMKWWANSREGKVSIHNPGKKPGWHRIPYPPMNYFYVWIPTQEQIQNKLKLEIDCTSHDVRKAFHHWYVRHCHNTDREMWNNDALWIDFYMCSIHNKTWPCHKKQWREYKYDKTN